MVNHVKEVTPDSLNYLIKDMFETITLYQNRVVETKSKKLDNGKYQVDIEFKVSKYRNNEKGQAIIEMTMSIVAIMTVFLGVLFGLVVVNRFNRGLLYMVRRSEIWFASRQTNDISTLSS